MAAATMVGMPKSPRSVAFATAASPFGDRRKARFCVAACGRDDQQPPPSMAAMPASLRAIQAKRKMAAQARGVPRATSAAGCAVAALAAAVEAVQGAAVGGASGAARGAGDAVAWVFQKVHFESPDLAVGLLGIVASCLGTAVEMEMERIRAKEADESASKAKATAVDDDDDGEDDAEEDLPMLVGLDVEKELWARIGIHHEEDDDMPLGVDDDEQEAIDAARAGIRKAAYERIIATSEANSLILSNYAQLLYEFDKDLDRAEDYFKRAVAIEPPDGEAMRRYAVFLWQARGDLAGAEDMFTGAIDEEPDSSHHRSSYAWFLWMTGGVETCVIDSGNNSGSNNETE
ncbi:hypothetical protein D1007_60964 [Hordeum vulgare]|uniref:Predicted protein n=1 Tax=Hordeum vulgare subsp. vulgare TaxID=112509 RepID=F2EAS5_HORVV|nr:uncharacterized protein LOC123433267 [Hordeum vulgare subsp. vulgare]KAE8767644.1 hypothetical protein D1007_60964 [Hordeum vulgare]BAK04447.1 predicted protein [Hordeum vulgare subsp. vulgare]